MPTLPPHAALLLDLDGTLLEIAPTPTSVVVPLELPGLLRRLRVLLDDAVAIVTGRPMSEVDTLLGDAPFAVAGEHGAAIRYAPGTPAEQATVAKIPVQWLEQSLRLAAQYPGVLVERKRHGFALHYRQAPQAGPALQQAMLAMLGGSTQHFVVMPAKMAWEMKPAGVDKGRGVKRLMARPPFAGRVPVFIGDDQTDEDGIRAAQALGGAGWRVQEAFGTPADVRNWLAQQAIILEEE